jgi:hypothetical protein
MTTIREFVIAAHGDLAAVQATLAEQPDWLNVEFDWSPGGGTETPIQAAAHVGNREIATYLLARGRRARGDGTEAHRAATRRAHARLEVLSARWV